MAATAARLIVSIVVSCAALALCARADNETVAGDVEKLQGPWKLVAAEIDGKKVSEESVKSVRLTVKGDRLIVKEDNKEEEATYKLDPTQKPRALDLTLKAGDRRETAKLIYDLQGDDLRICGGRAGKDRPKEFASRMGSGVSLLVFKREKE